MKRVLLTLSLAAACFATEIKVYDVQYVANENVSKTQPFSGYDFKVITLCKDGFKYTVFKTGYNMNVIPEMYYSNNASYPVKCQ